MIILALDTATASFGAALVDHGEVASGARGISSGSHARHLMGAIDDCLKSSGLTINEIDGLAVTVGPGSFTGLRIGISTAKALASALGKPVAGVSTLMALANSIKEENVAIQPAVDARKGQVYTAGFRRTSRGLIQETPEAAAAPEQWCDGVEEKTIFLGDGAAAYTHILKERLGDYAVFVHDDLNAISPQSVAALAEDRFRSKTEDTAASLAAVYIRKADAKLPKARLIAATSPLP